MGDWDPTERIEGGTAETGKQVGFKYAESYYRITLKPSRAVEAEGEAGAGVRFSASSSGATAVFSTLTQFR
ncbi:MAG: hypothetical protein H6661_00135 [Ardenticatenaceae bacterium]|nr:hypothetical protein [Ardenticatenaceae bacterium]